MLFLNYTPELTSLDRDIYRFVSDHLEQVVYMRIRELADNTHTSPTSVLRFCRKFECKGYSEFRIKLNMYLKTKKEDSINEMDEMAMIDFIHRTTQPHYRDKIIEAVELLKDKELILFLGSGSSNLIASYGSLYFSSIFKIALRIEDPINLPLDYLSKGLSEKICIVVLSVSGETAEIIKCLNHLNFTNSSIISITNSSKSTIAQLSDINIPYYISKEYNHYADITSQLPALYTIELLAKEVKKSQIINE